MVMLWFLVQTIKASLYPHALTSLLLTSPPPGTQANLSVWLIRVCGSY